MTQFSLTEDQLAIQEMARKFTADAITPFAAEWDDQHIFPRDTIKQAAELGFGGIYVSEDDEVEAVIIDHSESRGFCAGGDIAMSRESGMTDGREGREFFYKEYQLNQLLFEHPKPVVAFMKGITLGGGVGISQPAKYQVATEYTHFAMREPVSA